MNLVFVNHCHPDTPHVCAVRMREFANAMAGRGHRVVLLTSSLDDSPGPASPEETAAALADHDWTRPFHLETPPVGYRAVARARRRGIGYGVGKVLLATSYMLGSGVNPDWRAGVRPFLPLFARTFRPDAVWGTFGNTSTWVIARDVARAADCPWVADLKDHWESFIPSVLRGPLARRFSDAAVMTAFSEEHGRTVQRWFSRGATVVYSGVDPAAFSPAAEADRDAITLTGAIYDRAALARLIGGIRLFAESLPDDRRGRLLFRYAGHDSAVVAGVAGMLDGIVECDISAQKPFAEWAAVLSASRVNCYVKSGITFHHKLFDLLAAGRPVVTLPPETGEATGIATRAGGALHGARDEKETAAILADVLAASPARDDRIAERLSWAGSAPVLEAVLQQAAEGRP
jgi:hypothetical protein